MFKVATGLLAVCVTVISSPAMAGWGDGIKIGRPRSPVEVRLPDAPTRPRVTKPTGPRIKWNPRPVGLPDGAPWNEIKRKGKKPPKTFRSGGFGSGAHERFRKSFENRFPNGATVGESREDEGGNGRTEVGELGTSAIRRVPKFRRPF